MSSSGSPIQTSLIQAAQAQQVVSKGRDRAQAAASDRSQRYKDQVDLKVAGVENADAVRQLPHNESEEAEDEHRSNADHGPTDHPQIDVQA